ncbi:hypothetical protein PN36_03195 [Candidatus Thiomargarita nelsonii]|uniref:Uncharacterized protein n=1 Tax=Candidatus Thiomargarita nelsonii TaxID=1003181 RepID=A0A0A6P4Y7_9GAMM|nr:hypothetical protein PN36_03195 [Candidatus Thiomargarita nelsonii]
MTPQQYIGYGALAIIALYLAYVVSTSLISLFVVLIEILVYGILLGVIIWFLRKQGFFEFLKKRL